MRTNKYNISEKSSRKFYGIVFDSKAEGQEYLLAISNQRAGLITQLEVQKSFILQEGFTDAQGKRHQDIEYIADFYFYDKSQKRYRVIDVKGFETEVFKLKRKLFNYKYKEKGLYIEKNI